MVSGNLAGDVRTALGDMVSESGTRVFLGALYKSCVKIRTGDMVVLI